MRLIELLRAATDWTDEDSTIFVARPWSADAAAIIVAPAPEATDPVVREDVSYDYFLETFVAQPFLLGYDRSAEGAAASERERCERLIRYAVDDA